MKKARIISQLIEETGLSVKAFSEKAGIPYTTLRSILERGLGNASVDNAIKICRALGIQVEDLDKMIEEGYNPSSKNDSDILTKAAHKVGHEGPLTDEEKEKIELAIRVALARHNK